MNWKNDHTALSKLQLERRQTAIIIEVVFGKHWIETHYSVRISSIRDLFIYPMMEFINSDSHIVNLY